MTPSILFLDDEHGRHDEFARLTTKRGDTVNIEHAFTAAQAIELLQRVEFVQVFFDHDLAEGDLGVIDDARWGPTGMTVVDHIIAMASPPQDVVVHSMNTPARIKMARRLNRSGRVQLVRAFPFYELIARWR